MSAAEDLFHDLLRAAKVIVEIDGWAAHSDRVAFQRDRTRHSRLVAEGFVVLRFTWDDLTERPAYVLSTLRRALRIA